MSKKKELKEFVLDGSVALAWFFEDEADAYTDAVQDSLARAEAVVPALWPLEVANVLVVGERRGRSTAAKASLFLILLQSLPIRVDEETAARAWADTLSLARTHGLSAYDASYLELALRRGLPLSTLDTKLKSAAAAVGLAFYNP